MFSLFQSLRPSPGSWDFSNMRDGGLASPPVSPWTGLADVTSDFNCKCCPDSFVSLSSDGFFEHAQSSWRAHQILWTVSFVDQKAIEKMERNIPWNFRCKQNIESLNVCISLVCQCLTLITFATIPGMQHTCIFFSPFFIE